MSASPPPGVLRIGVAVAVPEPWGGELQRCRETFGDPLAAAIPPHVTLLPPTEVSQDRLPAVERHLQVVAAGEPSFELALSGTGTFRPVSPVVFVRLSRGISACERLEARVRSGPLARPLTFPYHPHVTVAHDLPDYALDVAFDELTGYSARFRITAFSLYAHGADGVWRPETSFDLAAPPAPSSVRG